MKQEILKLCEKVIIHNGYNGGMISCDKVNCDECPFGLNSLGYNSCLSIPNETNIQIAKEYINNNKSTPTDNINNPSHYNKGKIEVIEVIEDWKLNFNLGNAIKYIGRCEHKNNKSEDIKKAIWYLERELNNDK